MSGLDLQNVKMKALASLIRTFMETAAHPAFVHSLLHNLLYRAYVLNDDSVEAHPSLPPYFSADFFQIIRQVSLETPLNITTMSTAKS